MQLLLSRGADVNIRDDVGRSAFGYACELRCNDVVQILIKNNVDPDITDNEGKFCHALCYNFYMQQVWTYRCGHTGVDIQGHAC